MTTKVLLLGPGAIHLGDADATTLAIGEAAAALVADGHEVVVVTPRLSAPVCLQDGIALYVEPLTPASVAAIVARESPDHVLADLGGEEARLAARAPTMASTPEPVDARHEGDGPELEIVVAQDSAGAAAIVATSELVGARGVAAADAVLVFPAPIDATERAVAEAAALTAFREHSRGGGVGAVRIGLDRGAARVLAVRPWYTRGVAFAARARGLELGAASARLALDAPLAQALPPPAVHERVVVRVPRFSFEPFGARALDGVPKSSGEAFGIGKTFHEAWLRAVAGLDRPRPEGHVEASCDGRLEHALAAILAGADPAATASAAGGRPWLVSELAAAAAAARAFVASPNDRAALFGAKRAGFSDRALAELGQRSELELRTARLAQDVLPQLCAVYNGLYTLAYDGGAALAAEVAIAGPGPTRIGRTADMMTNVVEMIDRLARLGKRAILVDTSPRGSLAIAPAAVCLAPPDGEALAEIARLTGARVTSPLAAPEPEITISPADALKVDVDLLCDDTRAIVCGVVEYVERAGVAAGDSAAFVPPQLLAPELQRAVEERARAAALALGVPGAARIRIAISGADAEVAFAAPGASSTLPIHGRVSGARFAGDAIELALGGKLAQEDAAVPRFVVARECVLPFRLLDSDDPRLGGVTRSTGEGFGFADTMPRAYAKALAGVGVALGRPTAARPVALLVLAGAEKSVGVEIARRLRALGFELRVRGALREMLKAIRIPYQDGTSEPFAEGDVALALVTGSADSELSETRALRRHAMRAAVPYVTTIELALAVCAVLEEATPPPPMKLG